MTRNVCSRWSRGGWGISPVPGIIEGKRNDGVLPAELFPKLRLYCRSQLSVPVLQFHRLGEGTKPNTSMRIWFMLMLSHFYLLFPQLVAGGRTTRSHAFVVAMPVATVDRAAIDLPQSVWHARSQSGFPQKSLERANSILLRPAGDDTDDIDLETAMANARENLALGKSPGAGLESAFDQADAAYADLIVTSVDDQGITLDAQVKYLAAGGVPLCSRSMCRSPRWLSGQSRRSF